MHMTPKTYEQLTFRFNQNTAQMLDFLSLTRGRSRGEIVRAAITAYFNALTTMTIEAPVSDYEEYDYGFPITKPR